jgi:hypothetical protein
MKIKNRNPFKVPKGYFNSLEKSLLKKNQVNFNAGGFKIPKNYFNELEKEIFKKTIKISKLNNSKILKRALLTFSGIAASIIMFYIITTPYSVTPKSYAIQDKEVFEDFIETYYLEDFESYEIFSMLDENEIQNTFVYK